MRVIDGSRSQRCIEIETYCEVNSKKDIRNSNEFSSGKAWKICEKKKVADINFSFDSAANAWCWLLSCYSSKDRKFKKKAKQEEKLSSIVYNASSRRRFIQFFFAIFICGTQKKKRQRNTAKLSSSSLFFSSCVFFTFFQQTQKLSFAEDKKKRKKKVELKMGKIAYFKLMLIFISLDGSK